MTSIGKFTVRLLPAFLLLGKLGAMQAQENSSPAAAKIIEKAKAATVVVLAGEGAGRLHSISTGVLISSDGIILTAWHAVKGAQEVQIRLPGGDAFDQVQLLGMDERRDIAALKIAAGGLSFLAPATGSAPAQGDTVYAVTNSDGLLFSATSGIVSAIRPADEVPGAGAGFRLLQFTAPVAPGASGGALVDRDGGLLGIITSGLKGGAAFAIPVDSVLGLRDAGMHTRLGSGAQLQLPAKTSDAPQSSAAVAGAKPAQILHDARTIYIHSKTSFLTVDTVQRALVLQKDWDKLGLVLVQDQRVADLVIEIDRPLFTYVHTFVITDKKTSIVLGAGKDTAFDGTIASGPMAKDIVKILAGARLPAPEKK